LRIKKNEAKLPQKKRKRSSFFSKEALLLEKEAKIFIFASFSIKKSLAFFFTEKIIFSKNLNPIILFKFI
jgi:hypothetical protein